MQARPENVGSEEDGSEDHETHGTLGTSGVVLSHGRQREARIDKGGLDLLGTELVVAETGEGDRVAEVLLEGDGVHEDDKGGDDEENVLENTGHGKDNGRSLANLQATWVSNIEIWGEVDAAVAIPHTRKTTETLSRNATKAFARSVKMPTL